MVATTGGNSLKARRSLQCGARHILYHTTWCRSGGQIFPWPRRYVWTHYESRGETLHEEVIARQFARANNGILAGSDPELDTMNTENDLEKKKEVEERKLHRMAKVHDFLESWQGSENLHATQKESRAQNTQMTTGGYILHTEEIVKASWSRFQHDGAPAFKLSERSPLPPAFSAKELPGGRTQMLIFCRIRRINCHPVESDEDSATDSISDANE